MGDTNLTTVVSMDNVVQNTILSADKKSVYEGPFNYKEFKESDVYKSLDLSAEESRKLEAHIGNDKNRMVFIVQSDAGPDATKKAISSADENQRVYMGTIEDEPNGHKKMKIYSVYDDDINFSRANLINFTAPIEVRFQKPEVGNSHYLPQEALDTLRDDYNKKPEKSAVIEVRDTTQERGNDGLKIVLSEPNDGRSVGDLSPQNLAGAVAGLRKNGIGA